MNRKPGDWNCSACKHLNFSWRESCQRCDDPKPGGGSGGRADDREDYSGFRRGNSYSYSIGGRGSGGDYGRSYGGNFGFGGSEVRPGDWYCPMRSCGAHNFASRSSCFKCGEFKDDGAFGRGSGYDPGSRSSRASFGFGTSYNSGAGGFESTYNSGGGSGRSAWKAGDWICRRSGCNEHNFASRIECFRCQAPRESGTSF